MARLTNICMMRNLASCVHFHLCLAPYLQLNDSEAWTDLSDGDRLSGCREQCLRVLSVCGDDAGFYRCQVSNRAGTVVSDPIEVVLG